MNVLNIIYIIKSNPTGIQVHVVTIGTVGFVVIYAVFFVLRRKKKVRDYVHRCIKNICNRKKSSAPEEIKQQSMDEYESLQESDEDSTAVNIIDKDSEVVNIMDVEVPCTSWRCCSDMKGLIYRIRTKNLFIFMATVNTFLFFLFLAYTLPWVVLGFYVYPIKVLSRISFLFAAALCLMLNFAWILSHIERLSVHSKSRCLEFQTIKKASKNMFGLVASVFLLILLLLMGGLLYHIVFIFNSDNNTRLDELLTILPGLAISASAYVIHGKLSLPEGLGLEKKEGVKYRLVKEDDFLNMIPV